MWVIVGQKTAACWSGVVANCDWRASRGMRSDRWSRSLGDEVAGLTIAFGVLLTELEVRDTGEPSGEAVDRLSWPERRFPWKKE